MYAPFTLARKYLHYYRTALNGKGHGMHSPFVFLFILNVLNNGQGYAHPQQVEALRKQLLADKRLLHITDLGAGSRRGNAKNRTVRQLALTAAKPPKYGRMLYRLVRYYQPACILELGTSLGLSTAYLALANPTAQVITIEGSSEIRKIALENFKALGLSSIQSLEGAFDELLPQVLQINMHLDIVYVDGNHRYEPTIRYFNQLLSAVHNNTILIFDDIHWSREMERAWNEIKGHPAVRCTIDIFFTGFVFLRSEFREKQDFVIRF